MKSFFKPRRIYLDYSAATPLDSVILKKMKPYFNVHFGNPGALHEEGRISKKVLTESREAIAHSIGVLPEEIIFTSSGTEGNSLSILGHLGLLRKRGELHGTHVITSSAEHPSVLDCFRFFENEGVTVSYLDFNTEGLVEVESLKKLLLPHTTYVSIAYVNNEIGTIPPIKEIADTLRAHEKKHGTKIIFHTDACQAPLYLDCTPKNLGVDLMTIDGQKIYGPKGVGFIYRQKEVPLMGIMKGGGQEFGLRPGTENIPLIVGMKESFVQSAIHYKDEAEKITKLRDYFISEIDKKIPRAVLNGSRVHRSPNNVNISIPGMDNEYLVIALDEKGIAVATKSACLGHNNGVYSYVIESLSGSKEMARSALRFSLGRGTCMRDIGYTVSVLIAEVAKLDKVSL